ncbi:hypothetical protein B0H13DRAFT_1868499 [Mycena leptocephala]|nr:hypothetical protein B0H13DRAFT_1868499 [Mycena leptocephala]
MPLLGQAHLKHYTQRAVTHPSDPLITPLVTLHQTLEGIPEILWHHGPTLPANAAESTPQQVAEHMHKESPLCSPAHCSQVRYNIVDAGELAKSCTTQPSHMIEATTGTNAVDQHHAAPCPLMANVVHQFDSYPTPEHSLLVQIICIINDKSLHSSEITDRGGDLDHIGPGRFGLKASFFRRVSSASSSRHLFASKSGSRTTQLSLLRSSTNTASWRLCGSHFLDHRVEE